MPGPAKVACIILDAAEQSLLRTWPDQGLLPHFAKLLEESVFSETRNPEIIYSGTLWASFNTGMWPGRHDRDDLFPSAYRNEFPDLVIEWNAEAPIPAVRSPSVGEIRVESCNLRTGDHRPKGLVLAWSPHFKPHTLEGAVNVVDLAPTLAAQLGVQLSGIDGKPIPEFISVGRLATRKVYA